MMKCARIKIGIGVAIALFGTAAVGYGVQALGSAPQTQPVSAAATTLPSTQAADRPTAKVAVSDVKRLKQLRIDALAKAYLLSTQLYDRGLGDFIEVRQSERDLLDAKLSLADTPASRSAMLQEMLKDAKEQETMTASRFKAGLTSDLDVVGATADRLKVEIMIAEEAER